MGKEVFLDSHLILEQVLGYLAQIVDFGSEKQALPGKKNRFPFWHAREYLGVLSPTPTHTILKKTHIILKNPLRLSSSTPPPPLQKSNPTRSILGPTPPKRPPSGLIRRPTPLKIRPYPLRKRVPFLSYWVFLVRY